MKVLVSLTLALAAGAPACNERAFVRDTPVDLPRSTATTKAPLHAIVFRLRYDALYVDGSDVPVVRRGLDHASGFGPLEERRRTPNDLELPALGMVLDAKREQGSKDALLELGADAGYRELLALVSTVDLHRLRVWLAVEGVSGRRAIHVSRSARHGYDYEPIALVIAPLDGAFEISACRREALAGWVPERERAWCGSLSVRAEVARGCRGFGAGPAVPGPQSDFGALARCIEAARTWLVPGFPLDEVMLWLPPNVSYPSVIAILDAVRTGAADDANSPPASFIIPAPAP